MTPTTVHTLPTALYGQTPVTITVSGLPQEAAAAIAAFAERLTTGINLARTERQTALRAGHQVAEQGQGQTHDTVTEADRLLWARKGEERTRPVEAEVRVSPISGRAVVSLLGAEGTTARQSHIITLDAQLSYEDGKARSAAGEAIRRAGCQRPFRSPRRRPGVRPAGGHRDVPGGGQIIPRPRVGRVS